MLDEEMRRAADPDAGRAPGLEAAGAQVRQRRYRLQRDFDDIDRTEFREAAFATIRSYFEQAVAEIDGMEELRGRYVSLSPTSFGATIVNRGGIAERRM